MHCSSDREVQVSECHVSPAASRTDLPCSDVSCMIALGTGCDSRNGMRTIRVGSLFLLHEPFHSTIESSAPALTRHRIEHFRIFRAGCYSNI